MSRAVKMVTLLSLILFAVQGVGQDFISPEQAMEAVRAFEGNPKLEFRTVNLLTDPDLIPLYEIEPKEPEPKRWWFVDALTGEVMSAQYFDAIPDINSEEPFGPLTKEECRQIAKNFARAKYAGFEEMNFELTFEWWKGDGWLFRWTQKLAYGAWGANTVDVEVNPADGRIQGYKAVRVEQRPPRQPKITSEQAVNIAKQAMRLVTVYGAKPTLRALPDGSVRWGVSIGGELPSGDYKGGLVDIDAETGEVLDIVLESGEIPYQKTLKPETKGMFMIVEKWQMWIVSLVLLLGIIFLGLCLRHFFRFKSV